jgi:hypothetical protein
MIVVTLRHVDHEKGWGVTPPKIHLGTAGEVARCPDP